jgi:hypothetical protein
MPCIGNLPVNRLHHDALIAFKEPWLAAGLTVGTINKDLSAVRRVLNLAARIWRHTNGMTYLETPPVIPSHRRDLLGHTSDRMTTHYNAPDLSLLSTIGGLAIATVVAEVS